MGAIFWYFELFARFGFAGVWIAVFVLGASVVLVWFFVRALIDELRLRIWQLAHWDEVREARRLRKELARTVNNG